MIPLASGEWAARLRPEIGGAVAALAHRDIPVLRTMDDAATHPLAAACFPLVPYCNRIAEGRFSFGGRAIRIAPNMSPQHHPLHGLGWMRPWRVLRADGSSALLEDAYDGSGEWPWPYLAHQHVALDDTGCTLRLTVENRAAKPAPIGLGLHPYFRRSADSMVTFDAETMLGIDAQFLPDGARYPADHLAPWSAGAPVPATLVDHCFTGWSGTAHIRDTHGTIRLRAFGAPCCHVFMPPGGVDLCIEPVTHPPDALNREPAAMPVVAPGTAVAVVLRIES